MKKINSAEDYFLAKNQWDNILKQLREIILLTELTETLKWGIPTYTLDGKNVAGLVAFKSFVAIWFFNGVLLKDETYKLINAQAGKTKALRQWRFSSIEEIDSTLIKAYLKEAIKNQQEGKTVKPKKKKPLIIPEMLLSAFAENLELEKCFQEFGLSKQREFVDYLDDAKREETKIKRMEKIKALILAKIGLNDKYK